MPYSRQEVSEFYRGVADHLDALRSQLSTESEIDSKFSSFLATAAWEIRQDTDAVAAKLSEQIPDFMPAEAKGREQINSGAVTFELGESERLRQMRR